MSSIQWDVLSMEDIPDKRVRQALTRLRTKNRSQVDPHHIAAACLIGADAPLLETLKLALRQTCDVMAVTKSVVTRLEALDRNEEGVLFLNEISPALAQTFQEWSKRWQAEGGEHCPCGLELLLYCALKRINPSALDAMRSEFDVALLIAVLAQKIVAARTTPAIVTSSEHLSHSMPSTATSSMDVAYLVDLSAAARSGSAPPLGDSAPWREALDECVRALRRRHVRHILLVGERGVGKSELIVELARLLQSGIWPGSQSLHLSLADRRFIDPEESRPQLVVLLNQLGQSSDCVLAIDGLAGLLRGLGGRSHLLLLLGRLRNAVGRLIAMITPQEYEDLFASETEAADFFERINVPEPTVEQSLPLVSQYAHGLSLKHHLEIPKAAVELAVRLTSDYVLNDQLPAKAIKLLQIACDEASVDVDAPSQRQLLSEEIIIQVVARKTGMPKETLRGIAERADYAEVLRQRVFGQETAVNEVAAELGLIKGGMSDSGKPASVMLFLGQTGTGKTELAKVLARLYAPSQKLKVYTLGNCVEPHSVSTLIGVPPGYVGYDQGGRLVNDLNAEPYSVYLLDEADKAHPDVLQPFLNLFDEGWVMDQRGTRAYADRAIFILTSNVGQRMLGDMVREGRPWDEIIERMREAVTQLKHSKSNRPVFSAEFLARIKRFVLFRPLDLSALTAITQKAIADLSEVWKMKRGKQLRIEGVLVERLSQAAAEINEQKQREGGRIVRKLISEWIEVPLQRATSHDSHAYKNAKMVHVLLDTLHDNGKASPAIQVKWE